MSKKTLSGTGLRSALAGVVGTLLVAATIVAAGPAAPAAGPAVNGCARTGDPARVGRIAGISHPLAGRAGCPAHKISDAANGTPPLIFHGGPVMGTSSSGPVIVTPIFWNPAGHSITSDYKNILDTYLGDVARASGRRTNVFSTLNEYSGSNGIIHYEIQAGTAVNDANALPTDGCTVAATDTTDIYADNSGYDACLDDNQVIAETDNIVTAYRLPRDYAHIYVMFLPKHVESCFFPGSTTTAANACTINHQPSAAYCAYHSQAPASTNTIYANMPFPIYNSPVGFTCGTEKNFGAVQTPNRNPDADVEISPTSHELMEAITDPDTVTGWFDSSGFENGDECAYVFGSTQGAPGRLFNQVINGDRYLTQEEFSNINFWRTGGGCLQGT